MEVEDAKHNKDRISEFLRSQIVKILHNQGVTANVLLIIEEEKQKGEHFMSVTYNVKGSGEKEDGQKITVPFFVKSNVKNEIWKHAFKTELLFQKEIDFYSVILPTFDEFQKTYFRPQSGKSEENGLGVIPKCYIALSNGAEGIILMEDLMENGFSMLNREVGLDLEKSMLVMRSLGRLHAYSYSMKQKDPSAFQLLSNLTTEVFFGEHSEGVYGALFQKNAVAVMEAVRKTCPEAAEKLGSWLKDGIFRQMGRIAKEKDEYSVINHGDTWINNMLFRRSDANQWEVRFVDYQMVRHCSPVTDISYFLMTSTEPSVREQHMDTLLKEYHSTLLTCLTHFNCREPESILPYDQLEVQMKKYSFFGIGMALIFLPLYYIGESDAPDVQNFEDSSLGHLTRLHTAGMEKEVAQQRMVSLVKQCFQCGYI